MHDNSLYFISLYQVFQSLQYILQIILVDLDSTLGCRDPQPRAGRRVQRGLLQMVLPRRHVSVQKQGAAHRFLRRAHGHRSLAQRAGPRPHGSGRSPAQALEITKREADAPVRGVCLSFCSGLLQEQPNLKTQ